MFFSYRDITFTQCTMYLIWYATSRTLGWRRSGSCLTQTQRRIKVRTGCKKCPNSTPHATELSLPKSPCDHSDHNGRSPSEQSLEKGLSCSCYSALVGHGGGGGVGYFYPLLAESPSVGGAPFPWAGSQQWAVLGEAGWDKCGCEEPPAPSWPSPPPPLLTG